MPACLNRLRTLALRGRRLFAVISLIWLRRPSPQFIGAYLFAYLFMPRHFARLAGAGDAPPHDRRRLGLLHPPDSEAAAITMPLLTILFIPIVMSAKLLYPWANPDVYAATRFLASARPAG